MASKWEPSQRNNLSKTPEHEASKSQMHRLAWIYWWWETRILGRHKEGTRPTAAKRPLQLDNRSNDQLANTRTIRSIKSDQTRALRSACRQIESIKSRPPREVHQTPNGRTIEHRSNWTWPTIVPTNDQPSVRTRPYDPTDERTDELN